MRLVPLLVLLILILPACGESLRSGYITNKVYEEEREWISQERICRDFSKPETCTYYSQVHRDDPDWRLEIRICKTEDDCKKGRIYVDETTYHSVDIGDWFSTEGYKSENEYRFHNE